MFLLKMVPEVFDNVEMSPLMADWLEDNKPYHPEVNYYIKRLRQPRTLTMTVLFDTVAKFGERKERHWMRKSISKLFRQQHLAPKPYRRFFGDACVINTKYIPFVEILQKFLVDLKV